MLTPSIICKIHINRLINFSTQVKCIEIKSTRATLFARTFIINVLFIIITLSPFSFALQNGNKTLQNECNY